MVSEVFPKNYMHSIFTGVIKTLYRPVNKDLKTSNFGSNECKFEFSTPPTDRLQPKKHYFYKNFPQNNPWSFSF